MGWRDLLEPQFLEEPLVFGRVVSLLKDLAHRFLCQHAHGGIRGFRDLLEVDVEVVAGGHDVRVVDGLDERLDARALGDLLLGHVLCDGQRVAVDPSNDAVRVGAVLGAVVARAHDHGFAAGEAALQHQHNFALLEELWHCH